MLSDIFPRHIIEYLSSDGPPSTKGGLVDLDRAERMGRLARTHHGITILFMDIVG
jgi:hypothetical protein